MIICYLQSHNLYQKPLKMFMLFDPIIPLLNAFSRKIIRNAHRDLFTKIPLYHYSYEQNTGGEGQKKNKGPVEKKSWYIH